MDEYFGSYRTYEEWKHFEKSNCVSFDFVLTVPMRNGNRTLLSPRLSQDIVLTVPMRNGNVTGGLCCPPFRLVLTVPMRNGNH